MNRSNFITPSHPYFPEFFKELYQIPQRIYCRGNLELLNKTCISIVGTRNHSSYGEEMTKSIVEDLAIMDIVIVSGLAKGIDAIAHQAALDYGIPTIAVLGSGIENIYPRENLELACEIEKKGLIISEFPADSNPTKLTFPQRNRLVSAISIATLVVEAPEKSGALITARFALEQGKDIFVVPGDVDRENNLGTLRLLQKAAAYPISSGKDLIEVLSKQPPLFSEKRQSTEATSLSPHLDSDQKIIFNLIPKRSHGDLNKITEKTSLPINKILAILTSLEISGLIKIDNGKYHRRC